VNQHNWRKLVSGQNRGAGAAALRGLLCCASQVYKLAVLLRGGLYSLGVLKTYRAAVPVISVGNITTGGTGKTPLVVWLVKFLQGKGLSCAVLTRGYKAGKRCGKETSDEPAILASHCPGTKVIVEPDRIAGANEATEKFGADVIVLDDGFQHVRLGRDLDIVTIDALCPFGYEKLLPAGLLREPVWALRRAQAVVITRCDQQSEEQLARIEKKLRSVNPGLTVARSVHRALFAESLGGDSIALENLKGKKVFAFCGIGNPEAFFNTLELLGAQPAGTKAYADHHDYKGDDISDILTQASRLRAEYVLTTEKDWTRVAALLRKMKNESQTESAQSKQDVVFGCLHIELQLTAGAEQFKSLIESTLAGRISR